MHLGRRQRSVGTVGRVTVTGTVKICQQQTAIGRAKVDEIQPLTAFDAAKQLLQGRAVSQGWLAGDGTGPDCQRRMQSL